MMAWSASSACGIKLSRDMGWAVTYFVGDVVGVSGYVCVVFDLSSVYGVRKFLCVGVFIYPSVWLSFV